MEESGEDVEKKKKKKKRWKFPIPFKAKEIPQHLLLLRRLLLHFGRLRL